MKNTKGLEILVRRDDRCKLQEKDWQELVGARVEMLKPHLRDMSLKELGELRWMKDSFGEHTLKHDQPDVRGDEKYGLSLRGIFPSDGNPATLPYYEFQEGNKGMTYWAWGLTRDGGWITIQVHVLHNKWTEEIRGQEMFAQKVAWVEIKPSSLVEVLSFCKTSAKSVAGWLSSHITEWVTRREALYRKAKAVAEIIEQEERVIKIIDL